MELIEQQFTRRLVIRQAIVPFKVICAPAVGVVPAKSLVHVIIRECCGRPVVPVGAGFGVHEKTIEHAETLCQRMMIGRHRLRRAVWPPCSIAVSENREGWLAIRRVAIPRHFYVAEHLVVCTIFLDDVDDVLYGPVSGIMLWWFEIHQPIVLHGLLRVARQCGLVRQRHYADVSRYNRAAVLPALAIFFFVWRERRVRRIRRESSVAHAHRGWFESRPFTVPNEKDRKSTRLNSSHR